MTRESLAKDILTTMLPMFWGGPTAEGMTNAECFEYMAHMAIGQADALLEALGTTEPPASWLSKEMQKTGTPAGSLPVLKEEDRWIPKVGDKVRLPHAVGPSNPKAVVGTVQGYVRDGVAIVSVETCAWGPRVYEFPASNLELEAVK